MEQQSEAQAWMQMAAAMSPPPVGYGPVPPLDPAMVQSYVQMTYLQSLMPGVTPMSFASGTRSSALAEPTVSVSVEGMKFQYQLTEDDLRKVFGRYGIVKKISIDDSVPPSAFVTFSTLQEGQEAINDLNGKLLHGLEGTLRISWAADLAPTLPAPFPVMPYAGLGMSLESGGATMPWADSPSGVPFVPSPIAVEQGEDGAACKGGVRKYLCKFNIQIDNCPEFQVARKIIGPRGQNMQRIVKQTGVKIRLRGRGSGYLEPPDNQESPEPMNLSLSSTNLRVESVGGPTNNRDGYVEAKGMVEQLLRGVYDEYALHCKKTGRPMPDLQVQCIETALPGVPGVGSKGDASQRKQKKAFTDSILVREAKPESEQRAETTRDGQSFKAKGTGRRHRKQSEK